MLDPTQIDLQISAKEDELKTLKDQKEKLQKELLKNLETKPVFVLATFLHKKLCHYNHIDQCSRDYQNWWDINQQYSSRKEYYDKAQNAIEKFEKVWITDINQIIQILSWIL